MRVGRVLGDVIDVPSAVDEWARRHHVACLYFLGRDEPRATAVAEEAGFRLMDVRVELARPTAGVEADVLREASGEDGAPLREASGEDGAALRHLARGSHTSTRFYADAHFPEERCHDLYETWIARSLDGWADVVLVAELEGRPVGYATVHCDAGAGRGSLGLVGVAPDVRGRGLGQRLVHAAVGWCGSRRLAETTVATQARNVPALRTFEACGFRTRDVRLWFHKWYSP